MIETERLILRPWRDEDREAFAAINGDPQVGDWLGGPISREQSDALVDRVNAQIAADGFGFWAAERKADGRLVGMIGLRRNPAPPAPIAPELGWRLAPDVQGAGFATEGARAAMDWGFANLDADEILAWTAATNVRSQAVMRRIGMVHDPVRDFDHTALADGHPLRRHVVFVASRPG
jgi:RimJ/RimL family protein N-acetyltransferase